MYQPKEDHRQYMNLLGDDVTLFPDSELRSESRRKRFLEQVKNASHHLREIYFSQQASEHLKCSSDSGRGLKHLANKAYRLLEQHWNCQCPRRKAEPSMSRKAMLGLTSHQQLDSKSSLSDILKQSHIGATFEILLPTCEGCIEWKVTNIDVQQPG